MVLLLLVLLLLCANVVVTSPVKAAKAYLAASELVPAAMNDFGGSLTVTVVNDAAIDCDLTPSLRNLHPSGGKPDTGEDKEVVGSAKFIEARNDPSASLKILLDPPLATENDLEGNLKDPPANAVCHAVRKQSSGDLNNVAFGRKILGRDTDEAAGYHNFAMVCAQSKIHTDYCANRRRGYYCSQNGYLNLQPVSGSSLQRDGANMNHAGRGALLAVRNTMRVHQHKQWVYLSADIHVSTSGI